MCTHAFECRDAKANIHPTPKIFTWICLHMNIITYEQTRHIACTRLRVRMYINIHTPMYIWTMHCLGCESASPFDHRWRTKEYQRFRTEKPYHVNIRLRVRVHINIHTSCRDPTPNIIICVCSSCITSLRTNKAVNIVEHIFPKYNHV